MWQVYYLMNNKIQSNEQQFRPCLNGLTPLPSAKSCPLMDQVPTKLQTLRVSKTIDYELQIFSETDPTKKSVTQSITDSTDQFRI